MIFPLPLLLYFHFYPTSIISYTAIPISVGFSFENPKCEKNVLAAGAQAGTPLEKLNAGFWKGKEWVGEGKIGNWEENEGLVQLGGRGKLLPAAEVDEHSWSA